MSTHAASATADPPILWSFPGVSDESGQIKSFAQTYAEELWKPASHFVWRDRLIDAVRDISQQCAVQGWDGYDAEPITVETATGALTLLKSLPEGIQVPRVVPGPSGDISFEWRTRDQKHFSLSVTGPTIVYAGIFGGLFKHYGEERFFGVIPRTILDILVRYFPEA